MEKTSFKIETWQVLFVVVASAFAVVFLNALAYGVSSETVADSLTHTFFIATCVTLGVVYSSNPIFELSLAKRVLIISIVIFVATIIGVYLTKFFLAMFNNYGIENYQTPSYRTIIFSLIISYTFGLSTYFYQHSQNRLRRTKKLLQKKELDEAKAKSLAISAQLASLESKIHPHFLFNTLNSIAALIKEDPDLAEKTVEKLSALLRYSLDFEQNKLVTLKEELKITKDYLEIESTRFADKLDYNFEIEENLHSEKIPAFSLQTLVENSIKHTASKRSKPTKIDISAFNSNNSLKIEVKDNGKGFSEKDLKSGHGLDILRKRLENIFGNEAKLKIMDGGKVRLEFRV